MIVAGYPPWCDGEGHLQSSDSWGEDASPAGGLKDEVGTSQTQASAQCPSYPPESQQGSSSSSGSNTTQDPHLFAGPAGGLRIPEKQRSRVRDQKKCKGQDLKHSSPSLVEGFLIVLHYICCRLYFNQDVLVLLQYTKIHFFSGSALHNRRRSQFSKFPEGDRPGCVSAVHDGSVAGYQGGCVSVFAKILAALSNPLQTVATARRIVLTPCKAARGRRCVCERESACLATCLYSKCDSEPWRRPACCCLEGKSESSVMPITWGE